MCRNLLVSPHDDGDGSRTGHPVDIDRNGEWRKPEDGVYGVRFDHSATKARRWMGGQPYFS